MNSGEILQTAWEHEQIPILNGVVYADGRWLPLTILGGTILRGTEKRWDELNLEDEFTYFTELSRAEIPESTLDVVAGEGGLGTDGAIALVDRITNNFHWILFSETSNPFENVQVIDDQIEAITNHGATWLINIVDHSRISICVMKSKNE